jgi:hypothetical protein
MAVGFLGSSAFGSCFSPARLGTTHKIATATAEKIQPKEVVLERMNSSRTGHSAYRSSGFDDPDLGIVDGNSNPKAKPSKM